MQHNPKLRFPSVRLVMLCLDPRPFFRLALSRRCLKLCTTIFLCCMVLSFPEIRPLRPSMHLGRRNRSIKSRISLLTAMYGCLTLNPNTGHQYLLQAVIQCAAALKRRPIPDSASHASVGTEDDLAARAESRKSLDSLRLTRAHLEPFILSMADMQKWGYFVDIPDGPGGELPHLEGKIAKCERCTQPFQVKRKEDADECIYHWGKPYTTTINGKL
jgi:hypothetical protein